MHNNGIRRRYTLIAQETRKKLQSRFRIIIMTRKMCMASAIGFMILTTLLILSQHIRITTSTRTEKTVVKKYPTFESRQQHSDLDKTIQVLIKLPEFDSSLPHVIERHQETFEWLLAYTSASVHLHLVIPEESFKIADQMLTRINKTAQIVSKVTKYNLHALTNQLAAIAKTEFGQDHDFSNMMANRMPALLLPFYFTNMKHLILIDSNILIHSDIADLAAHFKHFTAKQMIGVALQQMPKYRDSFAMYEKHNPAAMLGKPSKPGFNTALLLLDFQKMRYSMTINAYIQYMTLRHLVHKYLFSKHNQLIITEDDILTLIGFEHPDIFYILPCGWNRQLEAKEFSHSEAKDYNHCDGKIYAEFMENDGHINAVSNYK